MTTPGPPEFSADTAGSRLLGVNQLQSVVDKLSTAVDKMASVAASQSQSGTNGTSTSYHRTGQTFTTGRFPRMSPASSSFSGSSYATTPMGGGGATGNPAGTLQQGMQSAGGMAQGMMSGGSGYSNQIMMNQYAAMSSLGMAPGTNLQSGFRSMYNQAFGNYSQGLNAIATNPLDAAQGYSTLQAIGASPYVNGTALGRAGYGAYSSFGISNPTLGAAGSAQAAAQLYSGQTSMLMRMYGYGGTPRAGMGSSSPQSSMQVMQEIIRRAYGRNNVNQSTLNAGLANNGKLRLNLQALGLDPNTMGPSLQMYNKLSLQGVSTSTAQTLMNDAAHNTAYKGQSAQKILSDKYGIATSDLQKLKDTTANSTGRTSAEMGGFDSALSQATTTIQHFDSAMNTVMKVLGLGTMSGFSHGFSGTMGSVGGMLGGLVGKGMGMLSRLGGAAPVGTGGHGTPGSTSNSNTNGAASGAIKMAESQLGKPYVWGGDNPSVGFDCSGLIEWAYAQAGVKLPRTSEEQWSYLRNRSVPIGSVQAGDILFSAGSDGTPNNPGHEAMAISAKQIIEAPHTGANIRIRSLDPSEWSHAGRPSGSGGGGGGLGFGGSGGNNGTGSVATSTGSGNAGLGLDPGSYGSSDELSNTASALLGGGGGGGYGGYQNLGNGQGSAGGPGRFKIPAGGGSAKANQALGKKMAAQMYGWTGHEWDALNSLWGTYESGWRNNAQNPHSTAFGIAQFLDSTWKPYGPKTSNAGLQIKYGLQYVHDRYKDPIGALKFELSHTPHWYGDGTGDARRGMALVGDRGPELVKLGGGQQVMNADKTAQILKGTHARPHQSGMSPLGLLLAPAPQNAGQHHGKCEVHLNMPTGAIVIHTQGSPSDVSNSVRQIMEGISNAMADDETVKRIMSGMMG